jgi:hypothetical protein
MKQNLDNLLEQIRSCETEEERQALLNQERMRIAGLDTGDSLRELEAIALRTKEIKAGEYWNKSIQLNLSEVGFRLARTLDVRDVYDAPCSL